MKSSNRVVRVGDVYCRISNGRVIRRRRVEEIKGDRVYAPVIWDHEDTALHRFSTLMVNRRYVLDETYMIEQLIKEYDSPDKSDDL